MVAWVEVTVVLNDGIASAGLREDAGAWRAYQSQITEAVIAPGVTSIGSWAFSGCDKLTSVTIPDSVTSIGDGVFSGCSSLTGIAIPETVTSIGDA